jgi:hypothetical protein
MAVLIDPAELLAGMAMIAAKSAPVARTTVEITRNKKKRIFGCLTFVPSDLF